MIENINYPAPKQKYKVLVRCFTYNQSKYIEDTLNGFAMQQTDFPFVCLVVDDASTDGEQEVIKGWMKRNCDMSRAETIDIPTSVVIIVPHKTNASCTFAFYLLKQNLYKAREEKMRHIMPWREKCKYEALCEGDDYWIDSVKLKKQADFLDANLDYSFTAHRCIVFDELLNKCQEYNDISDYEKSPDGIIIDFNYSKYITHTATLLFRIEAMSEYLKFVNDGGKGFDFVLIYFLKKAGKGFSFNLKMSVYRLNAGGIYGKQSVYTKLSQGYDMLKRLYYTENNSVTRNSYYSRYSSLFVASKGRILFKEDFEILKFLSLGYFLPLKLFRLLKRKFTR